MLPPRAHIAFLRDELGGFAVVGFEEVDGFLPFGEPKFGLGHIIKYHTSVFIEAAKVKTLHKPKLFCPYWVHIFFEERIPINAIFICQNRYFSKRVMQITIQIAIKH